MRSLFAKILVWFLATNAILIASMVLVSIVNYNLGRQQAEIPFPVLLRMMRDEIREARTAYETGGKPALAESLRRFKAVVDAEVVWTDASGRDLLTGEDRSSLVRESSERERERRRSPFPFPFLRPPLARQTPDGLYWFFVIQKQSPVAWFLQWQHLVIYGMAILLCWALARYLSSPVRSLQQAVEKFGRGDLATRAPANRGDELGGLARTFNQMAERLQTLVTAERRLLMDISHELRSPLARLAVAVELARSGHDHDASLDRIQKEADRLNTMVGELLEITRAEGDPAQRRHESVALDELLEELVEDSRLEAEARGTRIELALESAAVVDGDPELLRRAAENVVRNAIRYSPPEQAVEVRLVVAGGRATLSVRDRGPGVPDESLPMLFEPFYRVDPDRDRKSGGVGLGLSIARRSVELHGGVIRAVNANPGLRVEITLPAVSPRENSHTSSALPSRAPV